MEKEITKNEYLKALEVVEAYHTLLTEKLEFIKINDNHNEKAFRIFLAENSSMRTFSMISKYLGFDDDSEMLKMQKCDSWRLKQGGKWVEDFFKLREKFVNQ